MNKTAKKTEYFYDEAGRIIRAEDNNSYAVINWDNAEIDINFCNSIIRTVCEVRGLAGTINE